MARQPLNIKLWIPTSSLIWNIYLQIIQRHIMNKSIDMTHDHEIVKKCRDKSGLVFITLHCWYKTLSAGFILTQSILRKFIFHFILRTYNLAINIRGALNNVLFICFDFRN